MEIAPQQVTEEILALLEQSRDTDYFGEAISQLEHALQCAKLADEAGADEETILAALLHDLGHLCTTAGAARMGHLGMVSHEQQGAHYLRERGFSERVAQLVEGHVAAKRYLTFKDHRYREQLSAASLKTLTHQGGPMSPQEARAFEHDPLFHEKLRLRHWDEQAKQAGLAAPPLDQYRDRLQRHLQRWRA